MQQTGGSTANCLHPLIVQQFRTETRADGGSAFGRWQPEHRVGLCASVLAPLDSNQLPPPFGFEPAPHSPVPTRPAGLSSPTAANCSTVSLSGSSEMCEPFLAMVSGHCACTPSKGYICRDPEERSKPLSTRLNMNHRQDGHRADQSGASLVFLDGEFTSNSWGRNRTQSWRLMTVCAFLQVPPVA